LFFLISTSLFAQDFIIAGQVTDVEGDPVPNVTYFFKSDPNKKLRTSRDGKFEIQVKKGTIDTLFFKSIAFDSFGLYVGERLEKKGRKNNGLLVIDVVMPDKTVGMVYVTPDSPDTLIGTQEYSIEDFEFLEDGRIVLLTYDKTLEKGAVLRLMDKNLNETDKYYVDGDAKELTKDFRGNIHLIGEERIFLVQIKSNEFRVYLEDRDYYFKYVSPVIDSIGDNIYFSNYSALYPAFDYYEFNRKDSSYKVILEVKDTFMMEFYRAEYKYVDVRTKLWAHQKQIETGIDKEIWVGASVFTNSLYYTPLYAPLFKTSGDTLVVFDHYKNKMFRYLPEEGFIDSARISYHLNERKSGWEQPLIKDAITGNVYAMFEKNGYTYLSEIDKNSGHVKKSFKLYYKYVERIQIINGELFYIYRPFESIQKKYLYQEKLGA
jgi:hypothetical protein